MQKNKPALILILLVIINLSVFQGFSQEGRLWTLEECIDHAWENNLQLQQQKLSVDLAGENLTQSRANLFPTLNASASHSYNFGRRVDPFTNEFSTETVRTNNFGISTNLNLFSGFQVQNAIRQNRLDLEASQYDMERSYNDVALMVASAYLQVLFSIELVENAQNQVEISKQQVDRTTRLVEAGTLPRGSLLTIQAQLATEELQLVNAQNQLDLAYLNLIQIMFLPEDTEFAIAFPDVEIAVDEEPDRSPMQVYRVALNRQPEIRSADIRIASAERGLAIARGGHSPRLSLSGSYGSGYSEASLEIFDEQPTGLNQVFITDDGVTVLNPVTQFRTRRKPFGDQISDNLNRSIGLFVSVPIFNNYQVKSSIGRSQINLENARLQSQIVREQLFQTIQQAHADAVASLKRYAATEKNVVALEESFRYTEQRFNVGMVNSLEYNDAKNRLSAAQSELLQSKYEYLFRMKILDFYLGNPLTFN
jgi:outer membrane protein